MKKIIALSFMAFLALGLTAGITLHAVTEETTTTGTWATTTPETTTYTTPEGWEGYTYVNLQDLIDQMYQDVYDQIYADLYAELSGTILADIDEAIYDAVLAELQARINEGSLEVPLETFQSMIDQVVTLSSASVVGVTSYVGPEGEALGSAVIYHYDANADRYYLITNEHVVEGGDNYKVVFEDGTNVTATLHGVDATVDIAILSFSGFGLSQNIVLSPLGDSDALTKGTVVLAVGNPKGYDFYGSVNMGVISGLNRVVDVDPVLYIQHDASINSGNSGGPLYNLQGQVIGINVSKFASTEIEGMGFAIPINTVIDVIQSIVPATLP